MSEPAPDPRHKKRVSIFGERHVLDHLPEIPSLEFGECIGEGHFSHVYSGTYEGSPVAIKVIERGSDDLIANEIAILRRLQSVPHVVHLLNVFPAEQTVLLFDLLDGISTDDVLGHISPSRFRFLLSCILTALSGAHREGIIHSDVRLSNILVAPHFKEVTLIDWGCGHEITNDLSPKAGARTCRSPEMLLGYRNFGAAGDIWSVGVLILTILCGGDCPWKSKNDREALAKMSEFFGGDMFDEVAENLGLEISDEVSNQLAEEPFDTLESEFAEDFDDLRDPQLIDLMNSLLTFDIAQRPTADQALHHPYFAPRPERRRDRQVDASSARR